MQNNDKKKTKNFRKRSIEQVEDVDNKNPNQQLDEEDEEERRLALEEVKLLQKQRERKSGIPAYLTTTSSSNFTSTSISGLQSGSAAGGLGKSNGGTDKNNDADGGGGGGGGEKEELVLQDTFAQETAVMVEDPNMLKYVERELAKKRGKNIDASNQAETDLIRADDELYKIPEHLKVKRRNSEESSTQWTTGIAEIQLPIEFKLKNIEETEAAKKVLQDKRLSGRTKTESSIPSSFSADYFQRGKDHAEKLRKENGEPHKEKVAKADGVGSKPTETTTTTTTTTTTDAAGRREVASDQFMLERFRKRERHRVMRR